MDQLSSTADGIAGASFDGVEAMAIVLVALTARAIHDEAAALGLTLLQWRSFMELAGRPLRLKELGARLPASMPATSKLVTRLIERGFLAATPDPNDRRALQIALTDRGRDVRELILRRRRALIVAGIGPTALPAGLDEALHEIANRLRWQPATAEPTTEGR